MSLNALKRLLLSAIVISGAYATPVLAAEPHVLDEVVITGAPYARTAGDILSHVDVVTTEELSQLTGGLGDVLAHLPGVHSTFFGPGASRPVIRGFSGYRVQVLSNGLGMLDAASLSPDHAPAAEPMQAERIEIFRGPAALAYGGAAIGGVVNVIDNSVPTKLPTDGADVRLQSYMNSADSGIGFVGETTFAAGQTAVNIGLSTRQADDYEAPTGTVDNSGFDAQMASFGVAQHGRKGFIGLSAQRLETDYGIPGEEVSIDLEQTRYTLQGQYVLDSGWFERLSLTAGVSDYTHTEFEGAEVGTRFDVTGHEIRLEASQRADAKRPGGIGLQYATRDVEAEGDEAFLPAVTVVDYGVFAQKQIDLGLWGYDLGLRFDRGARETASLSRSFDNWSAAAGVYVRPADGLKLGLSLARTARAPSEAELFADGPHAATAAYEVGDDSLDSEIANTAELSATYSRGRFSADVHVFYADFKDYIDLFDSGDTEDGLPVYEFLQSDATFHGGELKLGVLLWQDGDDYLDADLSADIVRGETDFDRVPRLPPLTTTLGVNGQLRGFEGRLEWVHADDQTRVSVGEAATEGYDVINMSLQKAIAGTPITVMLNASNLTDEEVRLSTSFLKDTAPLPGRSWRIGLKASW